MAQLALQTPVQTGLAPSLVAAAAGGDAAQAGDTTFLIVKNASGGAITVTINSQVLCNQGTDHDLVVSVPATTGERWIGPLPPSRFADASGNAVITYSGVTSLTVAVVRVA